MTSLRINLLGGFEAHRASGAVVSLPTKKTQALLAYLALHPGQAHGRGALASLLWGDTDDAHARKSLRQAIYALRKALPSTRPAILVLEHEKVALNAAAIDVDVTELQRLVAKGTADALEQAAALYRGDLLHGFTLDEAPFEEWLLGERERLRELALGALAKLLAMQSKSGATESGIRTAVRLLALDPLQEIVHRTLMRLYARQGRRGAALRQYQICVSVLHRELGAEPETETKQVYQGVLQQRSSPAEKMGTVSTPARAPAGLAVVERPALPSAADLPAETMLVGRDADLARLRQALEDVTRGHGRVVMVVGEAGIGKTSVLLALAKEAEEQGARVLLGRSYESEQTLPFAPWVDAVRFGHVLVDEEVLATLPPVWRSELTRLLPEVAVPELPTPSNDQRRLFESVGRLVEALAARQPLVLLLEDLHWADEMSVRLLSFLGRRVQSWPVLVVATAREEEVPDAVALRGVLQELRRENHVTDLTLLPLSAEETAALVRSLVKVGRETVARLEAKIWRSSEGNPFMVVETLRALGEGATLASTAMPLPERVREVVASRLEKLSDRARALAAVAAVTGRDFEFAVVARASRLAEADAASAVEELVRRRILQNAGEGFDFTHARIREVAYAQLLPPRLKLLHGQVASALEELHRDDLVHHIGALGFHYQQAEVWDKAVEYLHQAGVQAIGRSAYREAVEFLNAAVGALGHLPAAREGLARSVDLRFDLRTALMAQAEFGRALVELREAERVATDLGDQRRLGRTLVYLTNQYYWIGEPQRAIEYGHRAQTIGAESGDLGTRVVASQYLAQAYHARGDYGQAMTLLRPNIEILTGSLARERLGQATLPAVSSRNYLALSLAKVGDFAEAIAVGREAMELAIAADQPHSLAFACVQLGTVYLESGRFTESIGVLERGLAARETAPSFHVSTISAVLGAAYAATGRRAEALPLAETAVEQAAALGLMAFQSQRLGWLAEVYLAAGRDADARQQAEAAVALARQQGARGEEAWNRRLLGELFSRVDPGATEEKYCSALTLAAGLGMRPLVAHCHLGLGELYIRIGKSSEARAEVTAATALYRAMEMTWWLPRAETALATVA